VAQRKFSTKRRNHFGDFLAVLLLLVLAIGLGWFWWREKHPQKITHHRVATTTVQPTLPLAKPVPVPAPAPAPVPVAPVHVQTPPEPVAPTLPPEVKITPPKTNDVVAPPSPLPVPLPTETSRPVRDTLETQVALARLAISPGSIDSANGSQTHAAIAAFQRSQHLTATGILDTNTRVRLLLAAPVLTTYIVTSNDLAGLQPIGKTWLEKSHQTELAYETELERVAETAHSNPSLIKKLNPGVVWSNLVTGTVLKIPDVNYPEPEDKAAFVVIHLSDRFLEAFDAQTNLLAHFPCSIAAKVDKRPLGALEVITVIPHPNYTVNPEMFPESEELQAMGRKVVVPPGPNNPVGVAWIGLNRPGYGMHGTPVPEQVGRTESHGCFRLANWDAAYMIKLAWVGMPVFVDP
jgi:lipoprotein-anchoring transpeptidase ErfK/SrfK